MVLFMVFSVTPTPKMGIRACVASFDAEAVIAARGLV
tara:strand:- start:9791 stop:9901 length:111 start_codon:yes stop_codon:yes gene_type:complete